MLLGGSRHNSTDNSDTKKRSVARKSTGGKSASPQVFSSAPVWPASQKEAPPIYKTSRKCHCDFEEY